MKVALISSPGEEAKAGGTKEVTKQWTVQNWKPAISSFQRFSVRCLALVAVASAAAAADVKKPPMSPSGSRLTHSLPPHAPPRPLVLPHGSPRPPISQPAAPTLAPNYHHGPYAPPPNYHHLYSGKARASSNGRT